MFVSPLEVYHLPAADTDSKAFPDPRLHVEPTAALQWLQAVEVPSSAASATTPAGIRRAFLHRAPQSQVLALYRQACLATGNASSVPAPWWLRALHRGEIDSRVTAFRIEDRVAQLLEPRTGWEFVPWAADGESGYWEFVPSEHGPSGYHVPTTLLLTDRHNGWIDILPAHTGPTPEPIAVDGLAGLRAQLGNIEALR